jgi:hypothetical protein
MYGQPIGSLSSQVQSLEWRLANYEAAGDFQAMHQKLAAVAALHPMCHGPEDRNWCATCNVQYPCPTRLALGHQ